MEKTMVSLEHVVITSTWREVNFTADALANFGVNLGPVGRQVFVGRPHDPFIQRVEDPNAIYFRFKEA
ncbi:hypothetical protein AQUCO_04400036v1 [Aquilegia coerulea]|uniref:Uncharacterized protein n=1 Tax=Aquilegia coerulea TaxID=218851 RepID=A0A2G5CML9_AQUCA|nr:hypothetical protein AQUCO_04400036v1 [Aquilegia coerulea]